MRPHQSVCVILSHKKGRRHFFVSTSAELSLVTPPPFFLCSCFSFPLSNAEHMLYQRWPTSWVKERCRFCLGSTGPVYLLSSQFLACSVSVTLNLYNFVFDETFPNRSLLCRYKCKRAHPARGSSSSWSSCCRPLWVLVLLWQTFCLLPSSSFSPGSSSVHICLFLLPPQLSFQQFHHCWWFQLINLDTAHFVPEEKHLFCWSRNKDIPVRKTCWQLLIHGGGMLHKNCTSVKSVRGVPFSATIKNIFFTWPVIFQHLFSCIQKWLSASPFCENSKGRGRKYDRGLVYYTWSDLHVRQWGLFLMCGVVFVPGGFSGFFLVVLSLVISV